MSSPWNRRPAPRRRWQATLEAIEARTLLAGGPLTVTITELDTNQSVAIVDNGSLDADPSPGRVSYSTPAASPFADFLVSGLSATSNRATATTEADLLQTGTIKRTTSTPGARQLQIKVTDTGFTSPTSLNTLQSSSSATFTQATPLDSSTFQSFVDDLPSPIVTLTPKAYGSSIPDSENGDAPDTPLAAVAAPFSMKNVYTLTLGPSGANNSPQVTISNTGVTSAIGTNTPPVLPVTFGGVVFADSNGDCIQQPGEPGLAGVVLTLTGTNAQGQPVSASTQADALGRYSFTADSLGQPLLPGTYAITEGALPPGYAPEGSTSTTPGAVLGTTAITKLTLASGQSSPADNFCAVVKPTGKLRSGDTATIGFWHNKNGQALINGLNGGPTATALGHWLATSFPDLYGPAGDNLGGKTNAQIAALFLQLFDVKGAKTEAQMLAVALAAYVTDASLAGNAAAGYGFNVSPSGTGAKTYNVGAYGSQVGLSNNTSYTVYQLLQQADLQRRAGTYNANAWNAIFDGINQGGDIK